MYNDVDNVDLATFNDSIDAEDFLFSNLHQTTSSNTNKLTPVSLPSSNNNSNGPSFLNEVDDDDQHLRHQHVAGGSGNVGIVVGGSSNTNTNQLHQHHNHHHHHHHHLPVDVDELLLNGNFLDSQPSCDQTEDPLWTWKDISDDQLNEFLATSQLNISNTINNNNNNSNNNNNTNTNTNNSNDNNINNNNNNYDNNNNNNNNSNNINGNTNILINNDNNNNNTNLGPTTSDLGSNGGLRLIQQDQYQNQLITLVQNNNQYQNFTTTRPQFISSLPQHVIRGDIKLPGCTSQSTLSNILIAQNQPISQAQAQQLNQPQRIIQQPNTIQLNPQLHNQFDGPSIQQPVVSTVQSYQQILPEIKSKISPSSNINNNIINDNLDSIFTTNINISNNHITNNINDDKNNNNSNNNNIGPSTSDTGSNGGIRSIQQPQYQNQLITLVQNHNQYQNFTTTRPQFIGTLPQHVIRGEIKLPGCTTQSTLSNILIAQNQPISQNQSQQLNLPQRVIPQNPIQLNNHSQGLFDSPSMIPPIVTTVQSFQQIIPENKSKISTSSNISNNIINDNLDSIFTTNINISNNTINNITTHDRNNNDNNNNQTNNLNQSSVDKEEKQESKKDGSMKQKTKEKQTRLDCPYCQRCFSKNFDLQQHMRCHTGEKPFQCIVCGRGFAQKSNVKKHMQAHKVWPEGPNNPTVPSSHAIARSRNNSASSSIGTPRDDECMQENESSQTNDNMGINISAPLGLSQDKKNEGNDIFAENRYSCSYCQFNGRTYFELKSHLTIHKREKVYKCIVSSCGKTFSGSDLQGFLDHVTGHKDLIYHCHLCSGQFYSLNEFGEHQKHHSNTQVKRTSSQQLTSQSQNQQLTPQPSNALSSQPTNSLRLQNQLVNPPLNSTTTTTSTTTTIQSQKITKTNYNNQSFSKTNQQTNTQPFSSTTTNSNSINVNDNINNGIISSSANNDMNDNTNDVDTDNNDKDNNQNQQTKKDHKFFRCTKCMNRYTTQTALDHHLSISTHNYPCNECNKVFMCERYLRRHLNTHTTIQHVCTFCDKQFKTAAYLKMHSVVHTGEKPFQCNLCDAAFNRRDKLNRHKLTHETIKKFKCPFKHHIGCTKEFNRPDKLKAHVLTHSGVRPHPCDSCPRTFTRLSRLREHKKLHHNQNDDDLQAKDELLDKHDVDMSPSLADPLSTESPRSSTMTLKDNN